MIRIDTTTANGTLIDSIGVDAVSAPVMRTNSRLVGIDDEYRLPPVSKYHLVQNYPNPFSAEGGSTFGGNPTTSIA